MEVVVSKAGNTGVYWLRQFVCLSLRCRTCSTRFFAPGRLLVMLFDGLRSVFLPRPLTVGLRGMFASNEEAWQGYKIEPSDTASRELQQIKRDLEHDRAQIAERSRELEEQLSGLADVAELRRVIDRQRLELAESIRHLQAARIEFEQAGANLLAQAKEQETASKLPPRELNELCSQLAQNTAELANAKTGWNETQRDLCELSRQVADSHARVDESLQHFQSQMVADIARVVHASIKQNGSRSAQHDRPITFRCSQCSTKLVVGAKQAGKTGVCKACNQTIVIPSRTAASLRAAASLEHQASSGLQPSTRG